MAEGRRGTKAAAKDMRSAARRNVARKVARNKQQYDKKWHQAATLVEQGAQILVKVGRFTQRVRGRLKYKYAGPFTVTAVDGRAAKYRDAEKVKAKTLRADVDDVKMPKQRGECYR